MWHKLLLQILIALLPIGTFQIWFNRPAKMRQMPLFLGAVCGLSMLLCMYYAMDCNQIMFELSFVPYIIGSLYGGIPVAAVLSALFLVVRLIQCASSAESVIGLLIFFLIFIPILFKSIIPFQGASRDRKIIIAYRFCAFMLVVDIVAVGKVYLSGATAHPDHTLLMVGVYAAVFCVATVLSVYYVDLGVERVQLQVQLREVSIKYRNEVRRLQQFIDIAPLVVVFIDRHGRVSHVNELALKLTQLDPREIVGHSYKTVLRLLDGDAVVRSVDRVLNGADPVAEVIKIQGRTFYTTACPIWEVWMQKMEGVLFIAHDMTELQRLKDEVDKMERLSLVGQMAASITHEIRNPMAVIRGFVQLLNERSPPAQQSYFRIVLEELDRANAIINDFLSLAQNRIVEKEMSSLHDVLNDMMPLIWADANMRGQTVDLALSEDTGLLELNVKEIKQLVLNLARNGMEAMHDKGVLHISTQDLHDRVLLRVSDEGVGIPPEKLERLFEPFFTTKAQGTGLGLALCLSIVERHHGKIQVESKVGEGTTFLVSFCKTGFDCW
ncbi:two-component system sensor histidine kinase NtrB [Cohnella nanjingensis]|uniref:histidine kinase n=1 Tax=Cohnella nanjingensis TaxID=1387779 RepID=A0A7X0VGW2_9BACL|nr:ATP-binding protein [Cohnella nanjingensis]MBB6673271.1 PAS domain-containing protein [Cohnella nanjingensis]